MEGKVVRGIKPEDHPVVTRILPYQVGPVAKVERLVTQPRGRSRLPLVLEPLQQVVLVSSVDPLMTDDG